MNLPYLPLALLLLLGSGCTTLRYSAADMVLEARVHREIALLPVEIHAAEPLDPRSSQALTLDTGETESYQHALYEALLRQTGRRVKVGVQPPERSRALLQAHAISLPQSWQLPPDSLAQVLGVDAVVRMQVSEIHSWPDMMTREERVEPSLLLPTPYPATFWRPFASAQRRSIRISCAIFSAHSGDLLWHMVVDRPTAKHSPQQAAVARASRQIARRFPYR